MEGIITDSLSTIDSSSSIDQSSKHTPISSITLSSPFLSMLNHSLSKNKARRHYNQILKRQSKMIFTSLAIPSISIDDYFNRIISMASIEDSVIISAFIYLDRLCRLNIALVDNNIHKLMLTAIVIAIKAHYDRHYSNAIYAKIGGITLKEMNMMEHEFLNLLRFDTYINEDLYTKYETYLKKLYIKS